MSEVWMRPAPFHTPPADFGRWPHIARHEAGHAVAQILGARDLYGNSYGFQAICIRPGATAPHIDRKGREGDCLGMVEGSVFHNAIGIADHLLQHGEDLRLASVQRMEWEIVSRLAGPFAEARSLGSRGRDSMMWSAMLDGGGHGSDGSDWSIATAVHKELCVVMRRKRVGWGRLYERTRRLVLDHWSAIDALGAALMVKHSLEFDEAYAIIAPHLPEEQKS